MLLLLAGVLAITASLLFHWRAHSYWKRRNVPSIPAEPIFGNIRELLFEKVTVARLFEDIYKQHKQHGLVGFYSFYKPMLLITNPELVKQVLVTHFNSFADGGFVIDSSVDPLVAISPAAAKGNSLWKELRGIQTPMQTPLKLKEILPGIIKIGESMIEYMKKHEGKHIVIKDIATRFTVGSVATSAYGVEPNSFTDPDFGFMKHATGEKLFDAMSTWSTFFPLFLPTFNKILNGRIVSKETENFFVSMISSVIEHREKTQSSRGDLIDTIRKANAKKLEQNSKAYTPVEMAGHCVTFYLDSIGALSDIMCFVMLELANHSDVQEKLREAIQAIGKTPEDFDYDKIHSIPYLQMVIDETMRLHTPVSMVSRTCTKEIMLNGVKIEEGIKLFLSPTVFHHDPEYYPKPNEYKPERFSEENRGSLVKYTFLPFGEGPRKCVGTNYAMLTLKIFLVSMLLKFKLLPTNGPQIIEYTPPSTFFLEPPADAKLKFEEL